MAEWLLPSPRRVISFEQKDLANARHAETLPR